MLIEREIGCACVRERNTVIERYRERKRERKGEEERSQDWERENNGINNTYIYKSTL